MNLDDMPNNDFWNSLKAEQRENFWTAVLKRLTIVFMIIGIVYMWKQSLWLFSKSPIQQEQDIATKVSTAIQSAEQGGRPTDV